MLVDVLANTRDRGKVLRDTFEDETRREQAREACLSADGAIFDILVVTLDRIKKVGDESEVEKLIAFVMDEKNVRSD